MNIQNLCSVFLILSLNLSCAHRSEKKSDTATDPSSKIASACLDSVCQLKVENYPQDIAVLIPPYADYKQVTIFLHGFVSGSERDRSLSALMQDFEIVKAFKESSSNRILIIPYSTGKNKDFQAHIKNRSDLQNLISNVYQAFAMKTKVEDVHLIGHGEAFQSVQNILQDGASGVDNLAISEVTLLNATYPNFKPRVYTQWLKSGDRKMTVIYLKNSKTQRKALELWSLYSGEKPGKEGGINLGNAEYLSLIPEAELRSADAHYQLVRKWFGRTL